MIMGEHDKDILILHKEGKATNKYTKGIIVQEH